MITNFSFKLSNKQWIQIITIFGIVLSVLGAIYIKTHPTVFSVGGAFQTLLTNIGIWGPILFILVQIIQVIYPVIPGGLTCVIGHALFGPFAGFIYNFSGIFIGSIMAFLLAKRYGKKFVNSFVSDKTYDKYISYLDNGKFFERFLAIAFILPGFPDDFLCMVAGISKMSLQKFIFIILITKPATLYLYTLIAYQGINIINQAIS